MVTKSRSGRKASRSSIEELRGFITYAKHKHANELATVVWLDLADHMLNFLAGVEPADELWLCRTLFNLVHLRRGPW